MEETPGTHPRRGWWMQLTAHPLSMQAAAWAAKMSLLRQWPSKSLPSQVAGVSMASLPMRVVTSAFASEEVLVAKAVEDAEVRARGWY